MKPSVFQCFIQNEEKPPQNIQSVSALQPRAVIWSCCSSQVAGTIASVFTSFSLMWGMFSCCKETSEVSLEEGQVEGLSYDFTVLLVSSQLSTPRTANSHWHLLHFLLLCLKHPVFLRGQCYAHTSKLKEKTVVNTVLSIRNSSSVHLP